MAPPPPSKHLSLFFLLLLSSLQIHARDSQFFSKVTPYSNNNDVKEAQLSQNEVSSFKPEDQPNFNQQGSQNGYGLYGRDDQADRFSTSTSNEPHYSVSSNLPASEEFAHGNHELYSNNNHGYETRQNSLSSENIANANYGYKPDNRFQENGNNYNGYKSGDQYSNNNDNGYQSEQYKSNNFNNNGYKTDEYRSRSSSNNNAYRPAEQQGMSDTRYLENGKYYYDINSEKSYANGYQTERGTNREYGSTSNRGVESRNQYYNGGYHGNNNEKAFRNSMAGYQNSEENFSNQGEFEP